MTNYKNPSVIYELSVEEGSFEFASNITSALSAAKIELSEIEEKVSDNFDTIQRLTPDCDKTDYILAASCGLLCGILDIFLVGKPGESPVGTVTDKWFVNRTTDFAKLCGWKGKEESTDSAIRFLERKFKIPYDQRGAGDAASWVFDLNPSNHHFKSLGHNPTLLGLFFSILDQFQDTSHFVTGGEMISLQTADSSLELRGNSVSGKLFCGFANWTGHLISDISGSSGSKGRGMGIPSPIWSWSNSVIAIKKSLNITPLEFDEAYNNIALEIYKEGYDIRFQTAQIIPVLINELIVRLFYSVRRSINYFSNTSKEDRSFKALWKSCEPFNNTSVKRMLTVAHGSFCLIDAGDAVARGFLTGGGYFNVAEFFMRLNIVGVGRFTVSMFGEVDRGIKRRKAKESAYFWTRKRTILNDYICGLESLADIYDDTQLLAFVKDLQDSELYKQAFEKSVLLAQKRNVPKDKILKDKSEIDRYFLGKSL